MDVFSISQLEQYSGIKAHTIRVWERRYNALKPIRSEGNTRYYDSIQLRRLLNIVSLMNSGNKISELSTFPDALLSGMLEEQLNPVSTLKSPEEYFISQLIAAGTSYDEYHFDKIFSHCILRLGVRDTYSQVIYPLLVRIGNKWETNTMPTSCEHFISNMLRQKLFSAIDALPPVNNTEDSWILFLPENEFHEIGLLFANYMIRQAGKKVYYLGSNVPLVALIDSVQHIDPSHLLFFLVHYNSPAKTQTYLKDLKKNFGNLKIHLSGNIKLIAQLKFESQMHWIKTANDLKNELI